MKVKYPSLTWVVSQVAAHKGSVFGLVFFSLVMAVGDWLEPQMLERFVNSATRGEYDILAIVGYLSLLTLTALPLVYWWKRRLVGRALFDLEQRLVLHLMRLDQTYYDRQNTSELIKHLQKGVEGTGDLIRSYFATSFLVQIPLAILAGFYVAQYSVTVVAILVLIMAMYLLIGMKLGKHMADREKAENELDTVIKARREEMAEHMPFLQQQRATDAFYQASRQRDEKQLAQYQGLTWWYTIFGLVSGKVQVVAGLLLVFFFLPNVVSGDMPIGTFFAIYIYMNYVVQPALSWGGIYADIKSAWSETEPLSAFFDEQPTIIDQEGAVPLPSLQQEVSIKALSFAYRGEENRPVLHDVTVTIPKGKMTAVVGESGGGKSTLAKLLLRQYDPVVGEIRFDDTPLTKATLYSIYRRVAYMPQRPPVFTGTIRENVNLRGIYNDDDILRALRDVQARFIVNGKDLSRSIEELSGGELQRVALARVVLQGADVIILDEATAVLDQVTERGVVEIFDQLCRSRGLTQVVIAHRLSTIMHADQIVVMKEGRVVAIGTHEELLESSLIYQDLMKTFKRQE